MIGIVIDVVILSFAMWLVHQGDIDWPQTVITVLVMTVVNFGIAIALAGTMGGWVLVPILIASCAMLVLRCKFDWKPTVLTALTMLAVKLWLFFPLYSFIYDHFFR